MHLTPLLVRADEAETVIDGPTSLITLLADSPETGGAVTINRATLAVGASGAPPHSHTRAAESFFVLDGERRCSSTSRSCNSPGVHSPLVPPGTTHAFAPPREKAADVLVVFTPGMRRFDYYRLLERVNVGEAEVAEIGASSEEFDNHYAVNADWNAREVPTIS